MARSRLTHADFTKAHDTSYALVRQANEAELAQNFAEAYDFQVEALTALRYYISILKPKTEDRRRAKLQLRHSAERVRWLSEYSQRTSTGSGSLASVVPTPIPLPSDMTINQEMMNPGSAVFLSMVERSIWTNLPNPNADQSPFLSPLLIPSLPATTYHVYFETETRHSGPPWHYFHIKDYSKSQTLYTMTCCGTFDSKVYADVCCTLFRASNCDKVCARVDFTPTGNIALACRTKIFSPAGTTIDATPDVRMKAWTPRRFTYGNRRFVWDAPEFKLKRDERSTGVFSSFLRMEELYEVTGEWDELDRSGRKGDERFERPLAWGEQTLLKMGGHLYTVSIAGGLDQLFREFILASMLAPIMLDLSFKDVTPPDQPRFSDN